MSISPSIRPPCGGTTGQTQKKFYGGCNQHRDKAIDNIKVKENITLMKDYLTGSYYNPNGVAPYAFAMQDLAPFCSPYWQGPVELGGFECGATGGTGNAQLPCGTPAITDIIPFATGSGTGSFDVGPYKNYYVQTDNTKSFSSCRNIGYKNAYAHKSWHGRHSYTSRTHGQYDSFDWCCSCGEHNLDSTPDDTKYLAMSATSNLHEHTAIYTITHDPIDPCDCVPTPTTPVVTLDTEIDIYANAANSVSIGKYTGNVTVGTCTSASSGCVGATPEDIHTCEEFYARYIFNQLGLADANVNELQSIYCKVIADQITAGKTPDLISGAGSNWHVEYHIDIDCFDHCGNLSSTTTRTWLKMDITATTLDIYTYGADTTYCPRHANDCTDCCDPWIQTSHKSYTYGPTSFTFIYDATGISSWSLDQTFHEEVNGSLSSTYTSGEVYQDVVNLLSYLPLGRDDILPWRTDDQVTKGPVCYYDERLNYPRMITCTEDTSSSGKIYGIPAPVGMDHVWNPAHKNYCICTDGTTDPPNRCAYIETNGAWNDSIGGGSPTAWLNDYEATSLPQGAFVGNGWFYSTPCTNNSGEIVKLVNGDFWGAKYAEIIFTKPSINFFRPCGVDRFQVSASKTTCISSITNGTVSLEPTSTGNEAVTNNYVWICGTGDWDGAWKVTRTDNYTFDLQEPRIVSASALPSQPIEQCGTGMFGLLRWQNLQPAICGRIDFSFNSNTSPIRLNLNEPSYLVNTDHIFIVGSSYAPINGYWEVNVIDNTTIELVGSTAATTLFTGSGQIYSPYTPDWKWNDDSPKNDYAIKTWTFNERDVGEYNRIVAYNAGRGAECDAPFPTCPAQAEPPEPRPYQKFWFDQEVSRIDCSSSCVPHNACAANVAYFSPNSESFVNTGSIIGSKNHGWGYVLYDSVYGAKWQGMVHQAIDDPFWEVPPCPCELNDASAYACVGSWKQDDGTCLADDIISDPPIKYYAKAPQVENRCEPPDGAPSMPAGKYLGCAKVQDFTSDITPPAANVCWYPTANSNDMFNMADGCDVYYKHYWAIPWVTYLNETSCVCNSGRFAQDYINDGVPCDSNLTVPAP